MRRLRFVCLFILTAASLVFSSHSSAQFIFEELSTAREKIVFPELTDDEKLAVAEQSRILLQGVYVHRFQKQDFYPGVIDPAVAIQEVVDNIDDLSVAEMEEQISEIFSSQRDLHLDYAFPQPYAGYQTFLPMAFKRIQGRRTFFEVRIDSVDDVRFTEFAPDQRLPEVGDQVVAYNGVPVRQAAEGILSVGRGANRFGGFSRALARLTFRPQLLSLVPEEDEVTLTLRSKNAGKGGRRFETYTITVPWITVVAAPEPETIQPASAQATDSPSLGITSKPKRKITREDLYRGEDMYQKLFAEFRAKNNLIPANVFPSNPSSEPVLTWGVIENRRGKFGYLNLASFVPETGVDATIAEIRRIIYDEFADTRGLIFDVRNNGGGFVALADFLPQLFTRRDAVVSKGRLLNTPENVEIFSVPVFNNFIPAALEELNNVAGTDATHTEPFESFNTSETVNQLGQLYSGPVAVFANANSYSASDVFSCQMQDSGAGFLFGEEPQTGAGGANVIGHNIFALLAPTVFSPLPATHQARVSQTQFIRQGLNQGEFIEDFGCKADLLVSPRASDLSDGGESQVDRITAALTYLSFFPQYRSSVRAPSNDLNVFRQKGDLNYPLEVRNTPIVRVTINGEVVDEIFSGRFFGNATVPFKLPDTLEVGTANTLLIEGVGFSGRRLWNLKRQVVILESEVEVGETGLVIDFSDATSVAPFSVINQNDAADGWNLVAPALQIGFAPEYVSDLDSDALLSLDLSALETAQLSFDMEYDTEIDFDFIDVFMTDEDGNATSYLRVSGAQALQTYEFDVSEFAGKAGVQLHFRFTSDGSVVAPGVRLQRVSIQQ